MKKTNFYLCLILAAMCVYIFKLQNSSKMGELGNWSSIVLLSAICAGTAGVIVYHYLHSISKVKLSTVAEWLLLINAGLFLIIFGNSPDLGINLFGASEIAFIVNVVFLGVVNYRERRAETAAKLALISKRKLIFEIPV